jgi:hypothetical protein
VPKKFTVHQKGPEFYSFLPTTYIIMLLWGHTIHNKIPTSQKLSITCNYQTDHIQKESYYLKDPYILYPLDSSLSI